MTFQKAKKICAVLLLLIFLYPSIVKLEHHHEHFVCHARHEKHFHTYHENCAICSFAFSVYSTNELKVYLVKEIVQGKYFNRYNPPLFSNNSHFSFFLRAPPDDVYFKQAIHIG